MTPRLHRRGRGGLRTTLPARGGGQPSSTTGIPSGSTNGSWHHQPCPTGRQTGERSGQTGRKLHGADTAPRGGLGGHQQGKWLGAQEDHFVDLPQRKKSYHPIALLSELRCTHSPGKKYRGCQEAEKPPANHLSRKIFSS